MKSYVAKELGTLSAYLTSRASRPNLWLTCSLSPNRWNEVVLHMLWVWLVQQRSIWVCVLLGKVWLVQSRCPLRRIVKVVIRRARHLSRHWHGTSDAWSIYARYETDDACL